MPPMAFMGVVTKVGCMNKTATVTVSRLVAHRRTGKVRFRCPAARLEMANMDFTGP